MYASLQRDSVRTERRSAADPRAERAARHQRRNRLEHIRMSEQADFGDTNFEQTALTPLTDD